MNLPQPYSTSSQLIFHLLKKLKAKGLPLLIITHDLSFAKQVADHLLHLNSANSLFLLFTFNT